MTVLDDNIALRNKYLEEHGLDAKDFGLNYQYPVIPYISWDWYKEHKFGTGAIYRRAGLFLIYLNIQGEPYLIDEVPYGVVRFLGTPTGVPEGDTAPKVLSQWGRRSEIHFEPMRDGTSWEALPHGSKVIHCESLVKAKAVHKATGFPCIGYNGVNGYSSAKQGVELIHEFSGFAFDKMDNVILFDSDVLTNPRVQKAREGLSHKLRHIANCPLVSLVDLPQKENPGALPSNWGPDDYLLEKGPEALTKLIAGAVPFQDEEFSSLVEAMNERALWVKDQSAVYDRERRALLKWFDASLTFKNLNREVVQGKTKKTVFGTDVWVKSVHRLEVDSVGYRYLGDEMFVREGRTFANEYVAAGAVAGTEGLKSDDLVLEMLRRLFKPDDLEQMRAYLKFLKFTGYKPTSYCVMWSTVRGVGKGWFTELARALLGSRHVAPATADSLAEKFNLHTVNTRLLIVHEFQASSGSNKKAALNYLKNYVGDETIMVRAMNRNPYSAEVMAGLIITTNDKYNMPSDGLGDRRQWYIEAGAGLKDMGVDLWGPEAQEWSYVWEALKDPEVMGRLARWVADGPDIDFRSWKPPMTEERIEDLMEGQSGPVQAAHEVLKDMLELGVRVCDGKLIKAAMIAKMDVQELYLNTFAFSRCLRGAGWWTDAEYSRITASKSAGWFVKAVDPRKVSKIDASMWLKEDLSKLIKEKY